MRKVLDLLNMKKVEMLVSEDDVSIASEIVVVVVEEALRSLDRYRLFGRELEVEFARGDRKSKLI